MEQHREVRSLADIFDGQSLSGNTLIDTDSDSDIIEEDDDPSTELDIGYCLTHMHLFI